MSKFHKKKKTKSQKKKKKEENFIAEQEKKKEQEKSKLGTVDDTFQERNCSLSSPDEDNNRKPEIIINTTIAEIWHKLDRSFHQPKVYAGFKFLSPISYTTIDNAIKMFLIGRLFLHSIDDEINQLKILDYKVTVEPSLEGLELVVYGFSDRILDIVHSFFKKLKNPSYNNNETFEAIKEKFIQRVTDEIQLNPLRRGKELIDIILSKFKYDPQLILRSVNHIKLEDCLSFHNYFMQRMKLKGVIIGNILKSTAQEFMVSHLKKFQFAVAEKSSLLYNAVLKLKNHSYIYRTTNQNSFDKNGVIANYYQFGKATSDDILKLKMITQKLDSECFNYLRVEKQLGSITGAELVLREDVAGILIYVQGSQKLPETINQHIEDLLPKSEKNFSQLTEDHVNTLKKTQITMFKQSDSTLYQRGKHYFEEMLTGTYEFLGTENHIKELERLTAEDLLKTYKKMFLDKGGKLSAQIYSRDTSDHINNYTMPAKKTYIDLNSTIINNLTQLRNTERFKRGPEKN